MPTRKETFGISKTVEKFDLQQFSPDKVEQFFRGWEFAKLYWQLPDGSRDTGYVFRRKTGEDTWYFEVRKMCYTVKLLRNDRTLGVTSVGDWEIDRDNGSLRFLAYMRDEPVCEITAKEGRTNFSILIKDEGKRRRQLTVDPLASGS